MSAPLLQQLDAKISFHRTEMERHMHEIERLETARSVLADLRAEAGNPTLTLKAEPVARKSEPITIRRIEAKPAKKNVRRAVGDEYFKQAQRAAKLRDDILAVLKAGPLISSDIQKQLGLEKSETGKKLVWNRLYLMKKDGLVLRDSDGSYRLRLPEPADA